LRPSALSGSGAFLQLWFFSTKFKFRC